MLEDADRSHILREILEGILQELGSLESSLRSIRDQFIPYLHDATSTAALGHIILQELLLDMTSHIGNAMDEVDQQQQAVQDAKVDLEQIRDDRMREALQRAKLTPGQVNMRILALQKHLKKKREDRDKAWATVIGMRQLRDAVVATVSNLQSMEMKPASFELAKMKQQYMMLYHQKLFCHLHMHLFQTRLQLHTQDVRYLGSLAPYRALPQGHTDLGQILSPMQTSTSPLCSTRMPTAACITPPDLGQQAMSATWPPLANLPPPSLVPGGPHPHSKQ